MRSGKTVLIVGGKEDSRVSLAESLMAHRYHVLEAETASEGAELARTHRPTLALLMDGDLTEMQRPEGDGVERMRVPDPANIEETVREVRSRIGLPFAARISPARLRRKARGAGKAQPAGRS